MENCVANLGVLISGADLVASSGVANTVSATSQNSGFEPSGVMNGENLRLQTGSHVDVKATSLLTGLASKSGSLTRVHFIDGGWNTFNFKALNSNRLQLGTKYTFGKTNNKNYYLGLTYEYEMSGTARASVYEIDLPDPSLKGSSGILEVGMQIKPSKVHYRHWTTRLYQQTARIIGQHKR